MGVCYSGWKTISPRKLELSFLLHSSCVIDINQCLSFYCIVVLWKLRYVLLRVTLTLIEVFVCRCKLRSLHLKPVWTKPYFFLRYHACLSFVLCCFGWCFCWNRAYIDNRLHCNCTLHSKEVRKRILRLNQHA